MAAATRADGDGAGGGSSHPDVTEQKDHFRHQHSHLCGRGEMHSALPLFRGGEKKTLPPAETMGRPYGASP